MEIHSNLGNRTFVSNVILRLPYCDFVKEMGVTTRLSHFYILTHCYASQVHRKH